MEKNVVFTEKPELASFVYRFRTEAPDYLMFTADLLTMWEYLTYMVNIQALLPGYMIRLEPMATYLTVAEYLEQFDPDKAAEGEEEPSEAGHAP